ncbi:hypothetical protein, partial [Mesorhizobium tamadayense]|uniref:hypothetical protein n=1 Tax=Mesorhizobium tamadayense TaxID=425306 RepID=UPI00197EC4C2
KNNDLGNLAFAHPKISPQKQAKNPCGRHLYWPKFGIGPVALGNVDMSWLLKCYGRHGRFSKSSVKNAISGRSAGLRLIATGVVALGRL